MGEVHVALELSDEVSAQSRPCSVPGWLTPCPFRQATSSCAGALEQSDKLAHPGTILGPATNRDERPVYHDLAVDELGASGPLVEIQIGVAGHRLTTRIARRHHKEWTVAVGRDRFARFGEVPDNRDRLRPIAEVLWARPPGRTEAS